MNILKRLLTGNIDFIQWKNHYLGSDKISKKVLLYGTVFDIKICSFREIERKYLSMRVYWIGYQWQKLFFKEVYCETSSKFGLYENLETVVIFLKALINLLWSLEKWRKKFWYICERIGKATMISRKNGEKVLIYVSVVLVFFSSN